MLQHVNLVDECVLEDPTALIFSIKGISLNSITTRLEMSLACWLKSQYFCLVYKSCLVLILTGTLTILNEVSFECPYFLQANAGVLP